MRFPLALTAKIARHIIKHKMLRTPKFALVLQLEPLHTCNLTCTGCGRIREYSTSLKDMMSLEDCLASAQECDAPMVSICGGEPQIEPIGASHSCAEARQSSSDIMSFRLVEYSRIRPHPVQVKLHVCSGSSWSTSANFGVRSILCLMM